MSTRTRYRLSVVGDFYVEDGCCTFCGVPAATAPELFGGFESDGSVSDDADQCWVRKQPSTSDELAAMIETMRTQELGCIRYCGSDPDIQRRLREVNAGSEIDAPLSAAAPGSALQLPSSSRTLGPSQLNADTSGKFISQVSVPCGHCAAPIGFGIHQCPRCGSTVAVDLKRALAERLEASNVEFRTLRNRIREVKVLLMCLGAVRIGLAVFSYSVSRDGPDVAELPVFDFLVLFDVLVGTGMLVAARFVEEHPRRVALAVLAAWALTQALVLLIAPLQFVIGLLGRVFFTVVLIRCVFSARAAEDLHRRLTGAYPANLVA